MQKLSSGVEFPFRSVGFLLFLRRGHQAFGFLGATLSTSGPAKSQKRPYLRASPKYRVETEGRSPCLLTGPRSLASQAHSRVGRVDTVVS